jgi:hypothetical protein
MQTVMGSLYVDKMRLLTTHSGWLHHDDVGQCQDMCTCCGKKASLHACMQTIHEGMFQSWQRHEWDGCLCLLRERQARKERGQVRC